MILNNACILTFDDAARVLPAGSVEVLRDGSIGRVSALRMPGHDTVDCGGRLLMPALINCHHHLYSTFARGLSLPGAPPRNFPRILRDLWWRLDRALTLDDVYYSALAGLIDSAKSGVATVIDHHSSPTCCVDSLETIAAAFREVGLRGATCYETSDRNGPAAAGDAIRENVRFLESRSRGTLVGAAFGLHASFTLGDRTLSECIEANQSLGGAFHLHMAEDACDRGAVRRLARAGVLDDRTLAAHCVHITPAERATLARRGVNVVHNPQSNCNNAVGAADLPGLIRHGVLTGLGTDGYSPRLWDELRTGLLIQRLRSGDPRVAWNETHAAFLNNRDIVRKIWGYDLGRIQTGARADLLLADYWAPTPIETANVPGHLFFGVANAPVDSLMVDGRWVVRERRCVTVDERRVAAKSAPLAKALWERI